MVKCSVGPVLRELDFISSADADEGAWRAMPNNVAAPVRAARNLGAKELLPKRQQKIGEDGHSFRGMQGLGPHGDRATEVLWRNR